MGSSAELRINLGALKRQDPYIESIIDTSTHVAVYSFSPQLNEWEKTEVEGTLFVYKRVAPPYWGFTILNRLSMDNLTEPLTTELEFQTQNPFLLYRNAKLLIYGIWFYDQDDCKRIGELLERLCRDSGTRISGNLNVKAINIFGNEEITQNKNVVTKSGSPTSNSINSVSPGSSVGGVNRPLSNGEADSESDDKDVTQNTKGSINILDLLSKAQDKYEKKKRNTPDPGIEIMQNGNFVSPIETEMPLVKPVAVKPSHPKKLDVASLFKQPVKPPDVTNPINIPNGQPIGHNPASLLPTPTVNATIGMTPQAIPTLPPPTANVSMPQLRNPTRPMGRSFSMSEAAMRQHIDAYMSGNVVSVEQIEAGLNRNAVTVNRQQQVNSTLDRMIDRINSGGAASTTATGLAQATTLPGIGEATQKFPVSNASNGNSGSMIVNGNHPLIESEVFSAENNKHLYAGSSVRAPTQTIVKPHDGVRQRSMSSSAMPPVKPSHIVANNALPPNIQYNTPNFATLPSLPLHAAVSNKPTTTFAAIVQSNSTPHISQQLLLHGNAVTTKPATSSNSIVSAVTTAVSSVTIKDQTGSKVPMNAAVLAQSKSSPALPATLISPEDFERSAATPQKKLELKQRMLQEVPQGQQTTVTPLTKDQLRQTLMSLLQKDSSFLTAIHEAYLTNFKQT